VISRYTGFVHTRQALFLRPKEKKCSKLLEKSLSEALESVSKNGSLSSTFDLIVTSNKIAQIFKLWAFVKRIRVLQDEFVETLFGYRWDNSCKIPENSVVFTITPISMKSPEIL